MSKDGRPIIFGDVVQIVNGTDIIQPLPTSGQVMNEYDNVCIKSRSIGITDPSNDITWRFKINGDPQELAIQQKEGKLFFLHNDASRWEIPTNNESIDPFHESWKDQYGTPRFINIPSDSSGKSICDVISLTLDSKGELIWAASDNVNYRN